MNPYETLGVPEDASEAEIDAAYRAKARQTHPDHGGDSEQFKRIADAHLILGDPDRRRQFDETGSTEHQPRTRIESCVASMLAKAFDQDREDPIRGMCGAMEIQREKHRKFVRDNTSHVKRLRIKLKKFLHANEATKNVEARDFIAQSLEFGIKEVERAIKLEEAEAEFCTEVMTYLNDLKCPPDGPQHVATYRASFFNSATSSGAWE